MPVDFDYIFSGAGCAGLSLATAMMKRPEFENSRVLIADKNLRKSNDRTWCFWEEKEGPFESIVFHRWKKVWFHGKEWSRCLDLDPYTYKMIRGMDFYQYCFSVLKNFPRVEFYEGEVKNISTDADKALLNIDGKIFSSNWIFNSILFGRPVIEEGQYYLLQHFKGWVIETADEVFDPGIATLMDFRTGQENGTTFIYLMPFTSQRALIEYTVFSEELLSPPDYTRALEQYLVKYPGLGEYKILDEEFGVIPMTNFPFSPGEGRICNIGTAGGQTKPSSGYTFRFIQKHSAAIIQSILENETPLVKKSDSVSRFEWYDSILLQILAEKKLEGRTIFELLFKKNKPTRILKFLDNETKFQEEVGILRSLPTWPFMKAGWNELKK